MSGSMNDFLKIYMEAQRTLNIDNASTRTFRRETIDAVNKFNNRLQALNLYTNYQDVQSKVLSIATDMQSILPDINAQISNNMISVNQKSVLEQINLIIDGLAQIALISASAFTRDSLYTQLVSLNNLASSNFSTIDELINFAKGDKSNDNNEIAKRSLKQATPSYTFDKLVGQEEIQANIEGALLANDISENEQKGIFIMLTGPPGTGKTRTAVAMANFFSSGVYHEFDLKSLSSPVIGKAEDELVRLFTKYKENGQKITFILDECDQILGEKVAPHIANIRTIFQTQLEGTEPIPSNFLFIGLTNYYNYIPPALKRRVTAKILVDVPRSEIAYKYFVDSINLSRLHVNSIEESQLYNFFNRLTNVGRLTIAGIKSLLYLARIETRRANKFDVDNNNQVFTRVEYVQGSPFTGTATGSSIITIPSIAALTTSVKQVEWMSESVYNEFIQNN